MTAAEFANLQYFVLQVFGPWVILFLGLLVGGAILISVLLPFMTVFRIMIKRS